MGSQGKRRTFARTTPDDFVVIYPKFKVKFEYKIPTKGIDVIEDFSVTYYMRQIENKDVYEYYPYQIYNHYDNAVTHIYNELAINNKSIIEKILLGM